jgi:putative redox protein
VKTVTITWNAEDSTFTARGSAPEFAVTMAGPRERVAAGTRLPPAGMTPTELMLSGVGGCTAWDVVEILRKQRQPVDGVEALVEGQQADEAPWPFTLVRITFIVRGRGVSRQAVERAVELSMTRYCSAVATIRGVAAIETVIDLVDVGGAGEGGAYGSSADVGAIDVPGSHPAGDVTRGAAGAPGGMQEAPTSR